MITTLIVSSYHPCDGGVWYAWLLLPLPATVAFFSTTPRCAATSILWNGIGASLVVVAIAFVDSNASGFISPSGSQCEPCAGCILVYGTSVYFTTIVVLAGVVGGLGELARWRSDS